MENIPVRIDDAGRLLIPKKIREYYKIKAHDILFLSKSEKGIIIEKEIDDTEKLVNKLEYLKKTFQIDYILVSKKTIVQASENYNEYLKSKLSNYHDFSDSKIEYKTKTILNNELEISKPHYYFFTRINDYKTLLIFVILNKEENKKQIYSHINMIL